jgi:hypothetical protein
MREVSESLAGRLALSELTPFIASELPAGGPTISGCAETIPMAAS